MRACRGRGVPLGDDFFGVGEDFGVVVLGPGLDADLGHGGDVVSVQGARVGIMSFKWSRDNRIPSEDFLAKSIEIRQFQQRGDREPFIGVRERLNQFRAQFTLHFRLHGQFKGNVRCGRGGGI